MLRKIVGLLSIFFLAVSSCHRTSGLVYQDGTFTGESRSVYTEESYYGITRISIKNDVITALEFKVMDKAKNEIFDEKYENHYKDIPEYIQQCRKDWQGVQTYPRLFNQVHDMDKVDAITGATWSYNLFRSSLLEALKNAVHN